jgi:hypothetical protein
MIKKLYYWLKIFVWEKNKEKMADEICAQVQKVDINIDVIDEINVKYDINLETDKWTFDVPTMSFIKQKPEQ